MQIPDHDALGAQQKKSKSGSIYKEKTKWETVFAVSGLAVFVCFLAFAIISINIQVTVEDKLHEGNKLFKHGQFLEAERVYQDAYRKISFFPAHADFGPAAYRYARALETNGKGRCGHSDLSGRTQKLQLDGLGGRHYLEACCFSQQRSSGRNLLEDEPRR